MVLIGPAGAGKSTLGALVAERLEVPFVDIDAVGEPYYREVGWSIAALRSRIAVVGRLAAEVEWEPARAHAVARVVADHPGSVIALGAGHTCYADAARLAVVRAALRSCGEVVLVLPSADPAVSLTLLRERCLASKGRGFVVDGHDFLAQWIEDPGTRSLATRVFYTGGETAEESAARLLG